MKEQHLSWVQVIQVAQEGIGVLWQQSHMQTCATNVGGLNG